MKDDLAYLSHIKDSIGWILEYTKQGKSAFLEDQKTRDAVIRNFEIIGEAPKKLSIEFKSRHPQVEWKRIAGMRDKIAHEYFGVNWDLIWDVIEKKLPVLKEQIEIHLREI